MSGCWECEHEVVALRLRPLAHAYVKQCLRCGAQVGPAIAHDSLSEADMKAAEFFDLAITERFLESTQAERLAAVERASAEWHAWYNQYLETPQWQRRRALVMKRANGQCEGCGKRPADRIHHLTYNHAGREFLWELRAVCGDCHDRFHGRGKYAVVQESVEDAVSQPGTPKPCLQHAHAASVAR
jgi:hypothetical protein